MYQTVSFISLITRFYLSYIILNNFPLFDNSPKGLILGQIVSVFVILQVICYYLNGRLISVWDIRSSAVRSFTYFLIYLPLLGVAWLLMFILTNVFKLLPIHF